MTKQERREERRQRLRSSPVHHVPGVLERRALEMRERRQPLRFVGRMKAGGTAGDEEDRARDSPRKLDEELREERIWGGGAMEWIEAPRHARVPFGVRDLAHQLRQALLQDGARHVGMTEDEAA